MDTEKCKIKLDSPENVYYSGQQIKGQICITFAKKTKIRGIYFKIYGYGKCSWCEFLRRESQHPTAEKEYQRSMVYSSREEYLSGKSYIIGSKASRPTELDPGSHSYEFTYTLNPNLPSTFKGSYGSIKYKMDFIVEKVWNFDDKYSIPIVIVKSRPLSPTFGGRPLTQQLTRNIGVFGGGPISLVAELPRSSAVRGNKLTLRVCVDNRSNTHVEKLKFSIKQTVSYFSQQPLPSIRKDEVIKIFKKETGGIQKKSDRTFEHELQLPPCQPSDKDCSKIIAIGYEVQVDAVLSGFYKKLTISLPFKVRSHESELPQVPPNNSVMGWIMLCPSPNAPISAEFPSSPIHFNGAGNINRTNSLASVGSSSSSYYNSAESSSFSLPSFSQMNSSGSSAYSNSPGTSSSNRSSFRHSIGFGSPPPHSSAPPPPFAHLRTGDLPPPSYEELFGNNPVLPESMPSKLG